MIVWLSKRSLGSALQMRPLPAMVVSNPLLFLSLLGPLLASLSLFVTSSSLTLSPASVLSASPSRLQVVPLPTYSTTGGTVVCLAEDFTIEIDESSLMGLAPPGDLLSAIEDVAKRLRNTRHQYLSTDGGREFFRSTSHETLDDIDDCHHYLASLVLTFTGLHADMSDAPSIFSQSILPVELRPDSEAYRLSVPLFQPGRIEAKTALGLYRGLTTFEQLFYHLRPSSGSHSNSESPAIAFSQEARQSEEQRLPVGSYAATGSDGHRQGSTTDLPGRVYAPFAPYEIDDQPAFGWRAVLLDTSRHYFSVLSIIKMLDTMSLVKLNTFHWHITDSNSWPLDLSAYPELAAHAAYSSREIYSEADVRSIVRYAGERGIDVFLEIDTPGHTATIAPSYPQHIACFEKSPWGNYAHQPPPGQLRFADPAVAEFTSGIFEAILPLMSTAYFGTGGDEINVNCMLEDEQTVAALASNGWTLDDALNDFTQRTHSALLRNGKIPVVWQEMVLKHGPMPALDNDTIVSIWVDSRDVRAVLDKGYRVVHAAGDYFYLDCGQGDWLAPEGGGNSWCDPFKTWDKMYSFDPYNNVTEAQRKLIMGGQTSLWAEQTDETNFESVLWPRAAAVADLFWTGAGPGGFPRSSVEALPRMHDVRYRMVDRGVRAVPLQPHWCAIRPGVCVRAAE